MEAITICSLAGLVGLSLAYVTSFFLNKIFPSKLDIGLAIFAIIMSMLVGIISGLIPSFKASNLDPIDALRYE